MREKEIHNVVIIGSGPAGYTAAIYAGRAMLEPVLVAGYAKGGQLMTTSDVENFPGYVEGVTGPEMMEQLENQAKRFGTKILECEVKSVDMGEHPFRVTLDDGWVLRTKAVIVATGAEAQWLGLENENKLRSGGLSACSVCDGAFYKDEQLLVIGGGDSAMEEAIFLTKYASKVTIVHRSNEFRASKIMLERARKNPKIEWITNATVKEWLDTDGNLSGAVLIVNDEEHKIECGGAFMAIGHKPVTKFLHGQVETNESGYILHKKHTMTSVPGIFACGDVCESNSRYKQAISASGQGCMAALDTEKWLEGRNMI